MLKISKTSKTDKFSAMILSMKFNYLHAFQHGLMTAFSVKRKKAIANWLHLFPSCFDEKATKKRFHRYDDLLIFHNSVLILQKLTKC